MDKQLADKEEKLRQKYTQFNLLQQQIEQISRHVEMLHEQNLELNISLNALGEMSKTKIDTEILAPIANGIFFKAALKDNSSLIVNVGSNITVERKVPEAAVLLENQKKEIAGQIREAELLLSELHDEAMKIYVEVEQEVQQS